jgi:uncharacterized protein YbjT (DUF2867 family)
VKVILFGATGMVGQGALRECLLSPDVDRVLLVGRTSANVNNPNAEELIAPDLFDLTRFEPQLTGYDACLFCLGVSAAGMKEPEYRRVTYDLTLSIAERLARLNPQMTFEYISGAGTNPQSRQMWARVKGETELALLRLPFKAAYMLRPGYIQPMHGIRSKTDWYQRMYDIFTPIYPIMVKLMRSFVLSTEELGQAMLHIASHGAPKPILTTSDLAKLATERR